MANPTQSESGLSVDRRQLLASAASVSSKLRKTPAGRDYDYRLHEMTVYPTLGTVPVTNKNPLSVLLAKIDNLFIFRRNTIDNA